MPDPSQILLYIVVLVLTTLLIVLGIQVFFVLRDLRTTIAKANKVLDNTGNITESVSAPISNLSQILSGLKTGAAFASMLRKIDKDE